MVHGLDKFKEYFRNHTNQYVFIGGTACDILMKELGAPFRATKDLDIVLIIETLDTSFGETFWKFIEDGGYEYREKGTGENQFYRFTEPRKSDYPKMIELFSRQPDSKLKFDTGLTPIHIDDSIISLSAILLNDAYYESLVEGKRTVDNYSVIEIETIILFKIKAWLDMKQRKENGDVVDSRNLKKHKNDIFRLLANVAPSSRMDVAEEIENDIRQFIEMINVDRPDLKNLGLRSSSFDELIEILENIYLKTSEAL
ncbi:nucleotidyl transferase AbiEii/AbiGii toxin family protein [Alkaliphilus serpentinus]|uniref:Nucleotidyl transferase AbiEii/AbiGii toxin family protein n=1 Tax=Alkaliphilus serpentinus TaxID=1482731 RepID=A0A833HL15_9FIRM|nr:nucleotidyl transferase AbiEii/AbiGii toxin family protein [Alkaliphilus serpentinus]KAB3524851.1 nucleotidyl transferase AbiEii/AbiGii toxin family protein [Alkaliphilus serpentinus]